MDDEKRKIPDDSVLFLRGEVKRLRILLEVFGDEDLELERFISATVKAADELEALRERNHYLSQRLGGLL